MCNSCYCSVSVPTAWETHIMHSKRCLTASRFRANTLFICFNPLPFCVSCNGFSDAHYIPFYMYTLVLSSASILWACFIMCIAFFFVCIAFILTFFFIFSLCASFYFHSISCSVLFLSAVFFSISSWTAWVFFLLYRVAIQSDKRFDGRKRKKERNEKPFLAVHALYFNANLSARSLFNGFVFSALFSCCFSFFFVFSLPLAK